MTINSGRVMEKVEYEVEIYAPGVGDSKSGLMIYTKSKMPLMTFNRGDLINTYHLDLTKYHPLEDREILRVVGIEHSFFESAGGQFFHKVMVFTERAENTPDARLGK